jgi:DNA-binding beta-propeller fold protein YncE
MIATDQAGAEERLRSAFADATATVRDDQLRHDAPVRPQGRLSGPGRGRLLIPASAAAAVLAVSIAAVTVPQSVLHAGSHGRSSNVPPVVGPAAYVVASTSGNQGFSDSIVRISLTTGRMVEPVIKLPPGQATAEATPDDKIICVLTDTLRRAYLTTFNVRSGVISQPIMIPAGDVNSHPLSFVITPNGRTAYVLVQPLPAGPRAPAVAGGVVPVNLVAGSVGRKITVPGAQDLVITPDGRTVYVLTQQDASRRGAQYYGSHPVVPIDTATNTALRPVKISAGGLADSIAVSPDGKTIYVATFWVNHRSAVTPISTASNTPLTPRPIWLSPYSGASLAIAPDGNTAYVYGNSGYVTPVNLHTDRVLRAIKLPQDYGCVMSKKTCEATYAWTFEIAPDSRAAYLYGPPDADVIPIDLTTGTVQAPLVVGQPPYTQIAWGSAGQGVGFSSGYLYAGLGYITSPTHNAQWHGAFSEVQLATGRIKTIEMGDYWPQQIILTP